MHKNFSASTFRGLLEKKYSWFDSRIVTDETIYVIFMSFANGRGTKILNANDLTRYSAVATLVRPMIIHDIMKDPGAIVAHMKKALSGEVSW